MWLLLLTASAMIQNTRQHIFYPVNYCMMSAQCVHDGRPVCAVTPEGCKRTFLDQCDLFEYNCDFGTRYRQTYYIHCLGSNLMNTPQHCLQSPPKDINRPRPIAEDEKENEIIPQITFTTENYVKNPMPPCAIHLLPPCDCSKPNNCGDKQLTEQTTDSTVSQYSLTTKEISPTTESTTITKRSTNTKKSTITKISTTTKRSTKTKRLITTKWSTFAKEISTTQRSTTSERPTATEKSTTTKRPTKLKTSTVSATSKSTTESTRTLMTITTTETRPNIAFSTSSAIPTTEIPTTTRETTTTTNPTTSTATTKIIRDVEPNTTPNITTYKMLNTSISLTTKCCDMPKTWDTTLHDTSAYNVITNIISATITDTKSTTTKNKEITTTPEEVKSEQSQRPPITTNFYGSSSSNMYTTKCCDVPQSWETTTENIKIISFADPELSVASKEKDTDVSISSITSTSTQGTITIPTTKIPVTTKVSSTEPNTEVDTVPSTTAVTICCDRPKIWETTSESIRKVITDFVKPDTKLTTSSTTTKLKPSTTAYMTTTVYNPTSTTIATSELTTNSVKTTKTTTLKHIPSTLSSIIDKTVTGETTDRKIAPISVCCDRPKTWDTTTENIILNIITYYIKPKTNVTTSTEPTQKLMTTTPTTVKSSSVSSTSSPDITTTSTSTVRHITLPFHSSTLTSSSLPSITSFDVNTTSKPTKFSFYTPSVIKTEITDKTVTTCCDRPRTWQTTSENTKKIIDISMEPETKYTIASFTLITGPSENSTDTADNKTSSASIYINLTNSSVPTTIVEKTKTTTETAITTKTTILVTECCDRPTIWDITPTIWKMYTKLPSTTDSESTGKLKTVITTKIANPSTTIVEKNVTKLMFPDHSKKITAFTDKVTSNSLETVTKQIESSTYKIETKTTQTKRTPILTLKSTISHISSEEYYTESDESIKTEITKLHKTPKASTNNQGYQDKTTWWYPRLCQPGKCHIPITWMTTPKKRRKMKSLR